MSRSRRKIPIRGICSDSDKRDKVNSSRSLRRATRNALRQGKEIPHEREYRDPWNWSKDGKIYYTNSPEVMRK